MPENDHVYFIGGPADLSKRAYPPDRVPHTIDVLEELPYVGPPTSEIRYKKHAYIVRRLGPSLFLALHPDALR